MSDRAAKAFFPNLNALRFFAAAVVVVNHIEGVKRALERPNWFNEDRVEFAASLAVTFFFTLSGFLITYLLLTEKAATGAISIRNFYARRSLRIWPLYYLIVILSLYVVPHFSWFDMPTTQRIQDRLGLNTLLYLLILPNVAFSFLGPLPCGVQTWSIGVEEQFYLTWPWLIRLFNRPLFILAAIFVGFAALHAAVGPETVADWRLRHLLNHLQIGCMAAGGIGAVLVHRRTTWFLRVVGNRACFWAAVLAAACLFAAGPSKWRPHELFSVMFLAIIVHLGTSPRTAVDLTHRSLDSLGNVSYGIYMHHLIPITLLIRAQDAAGMDPHGAAYHVLLYVGAFALTIAMSFASYRWLEAPLLRLKRRFETAAPAARPVPAVAATAAAVAVDRDR